MTESNGSVGIEVQVPVLGTLVGTRTLKDIVAGIAGVAVKPPVDGPAVTVKDPDARTLAALTGAAAAPAVKKTDEAIAPAAPAAPAVVEAAPAVDAEAEAKKMLQFAENYLQANMKYKAIIKYEELVKKYPQTEAGKTAKAKLATLGG